MTKKWIPASAGMTSEKGQTMTRKEVEKKKKELTEILKEENDGVRLERLQKLAKEVGASVTRMEKIQVRHEFTTSGQIIYKPSNEITEMEIVHNIQVALQTETMIDMCKTASRNFIIALAASAIALLSTIATWVMALKK
jgi:hypothetical protein